MDILFVRQGEYEKGDAAFSLIRQAVRSYLAENRVSFPDDPDFPVIKRSEEGRPYIDRPDDNTVDISVTHSGDIWMCLVSGKRCGLDIQYIKKVNAEKLASRFFTEGEQEYIKEDPGRFFDIWVRREALGKYEGHGFFGEYPDSAPDGEPAETAAFPEDSAYSGRVYIHMIAEEILQSCGVEPEGEFRLAAVTCTGEMPEIRCI